MKKIPLVPDDAKRLLSQLRLLAHPELERIKPPNDYNSNEVFFYPSGPPVMPISLYINEHKILKCLQPIERLLQSIANSSLDQLKFDNELLKDRPSSCESYKSHGTSSSLFIFNPKGKVVQLLSQVSNLSEILKHLPINYLPANIQAFHLAFREERLSKVIYSELYKRDIISQYTPLYKYKILGMYSPAVIDAYRSVTEHNSAGLHIEFNYKYPYLQRESKLNYKEASDYLKTFNDRYRILLGLLKNRKIYLSLRDHYKCSFAHYDRVRHLFEVEAKKHTRILMMYLEFYHDSEILDDPELIESAYQQIHKTRERFLKGRKSKEIFSNLISYAWKYRYSDKAGIVCSMVLLYDDKHRFSPDDLSHIMARYMNYDIPKNNIQASVTPVYHRVNIRVAYDKYMITEEKESKDIFASLARMMTLYDLYIKPEPPKKFKVFGAPAIKKKAKQTRKPRPMMRYINPVDLEAVDCKSMSNKKIQEWIKKYGYERVKTWGKNLSNQEKRPNETAVTDCPPGFIFPNKERFRPPGPWENRSTDKDGSKT